MPGVTRCSASIWRLGLHWGGHGEYPFSKIQAQKLQPPGWQQQALEIIRRMKQSADQRPAGFDDFWCDVSVYVFMFAWLRWPAWGWEAKLGDDPSGLIVFNSVETHKLAIYDHIWCWVVAASCCIKLCYCVCLWEIALYIIFRLAWYVWNVV